MRQVIMMLAGLVLLAGGAEAASCQISPQAATQMSDMVNQQRAAQGLPALAQDDRLAQAAQAHACDMARKGYFSHTAPNGATAQTRVKSTGYRACLSAENISYGWPDTARAMQDLMQSSGHRANILRRQARAIGIGVVPKQGSAGPWYVQVFAAPC